VADACKMVIIVPSEKCDQKMDESDGSDAIFVDGKEVMSLWTMGPDSVRVVSSSLRTGACQVGASISVVSEINNDKPASMRWESGFPAASRYLIFVAYGDLSNDP